MATPIRSLLSIFGRHEWWTAKKEQRTDEECGERKRVRVEAASSSPKAKVAAKVEENTPSLCLGQRACYADCCFFLNSSTTQLTLFLISAFRLSHSTPNLSPHGLQNSVL